ncbi:aromatic amino acid lyase [Lentisphaerota bacterium ZTH]|nr:aromatic amino acid lyase [Lentisphaerota bacterium]WET06545.1 aromatic amino acid lyase [Lentisphaerota bacterium ZTH]
MNKRKLPIAFIAVFVVFFCIKSFSSTVILGKKPITPEQIIRIAYGAKVKIAPEAFSRVQTGFKILIRAAETGHEIYGLTNGVGENKDQREINPDGKLSEAVVKASEEFNRSLIQAHCAALGKAMSIQLARAVMATRLNNMLSGNSGVSPRVVKMLAAFLNRDVTPEIPEFGSIGEADITVLGHIGLAMIGKGKAYYKGKLLPAAKALSQAGLSPIVLFGKDALAIISSNAYSSALTAFALVKLHHLSKIYKLVYAASLEGLNGNVNPFMKAALQLRPFPYASRAAAQIRKYLKGSYLWSQDEQRALQDPLSYRCIAFIAGNLDRSIASVDNLMKIQYNSSDDNPAVVLSYKNENSDYAHKKIGVKYNNSSCAVVPTANFDPVIWAAGFEQVSLALGICSKAATARTLKLSKTQFTNLSRFLGTRNTTHAYGAIQKPFVALNAENEYLANPIMLNFEPVAGDIEDFATNAPLVLNKVLKQIDNLYGILAFELLHSAQALDLRKQKNPRLKLSYATQLLFNKYRQVVKFMDKDRAFSDDIKKSTAFLEDLDINQFEHLQI